MFHRILVGVDDSRAAKAALERAVELVEAGHGRLGLLSSAPGPPRSLDRARWSCRSAAPSSSSS